MLSVLTECATCLSLTQFFIYFHETLWVLIYLYITFCTSTCWVPIMIIQMPIFTALCVFIVTFHKEIFSYLNNSYTIDADKLGQLGPSLGMKKSSSLESLQTMVQEVRKA